MKKYWNETKHKDVFFVVEEHGNELIPKINGGSCGWSTTIALLFVTQRILTGY